MTPLHAHHLLLVGGWALHFLFVSYVVAGTATVLVASLRRGSAEPGPLERVLADWLPAALSGAITAGVVPLLFVQTLHPQDFYTASIILFWRAVPLLPALVVGFYLLYVVKAREASRPRAAAAAGSLLCWLFAAFTWTSIHMLGGRAGGETIDAYAGGALTWWPPELLPRIVAWLGLMVSTGLAIAVWQVRRTEGAPIRLMALGAWAGTALAVAAALAQAEAGARFHGTWEWLTLVGLVITTLSWSLVLGARPRVTLAAAGTGIGSLVAVSGTALLREALRVPHGRTHPPADAVIEGQGFVTFVVFAVLVTVAVAFVFRSVSRDLRAAAGEPPT